MSVCKLGLFFTREQLMYSRPFVSLFALPFYLSVSQKQYYFNFLIGGGNKKHLTYNTSERLKPVFSKYSL